MMKVAIMQPYFCPYIGYFQLISSVDRFVIYDNVQYTKKGWFNRNRYLHNGQAELFTIPLMKESDFLNVRDRHLADDSLKARRRILSKLAQAYRSAPYVDEVMGLLERLFLYQGANLFEFIYHSVVVLCRELGIDTDIVISSTIKVPDELKGSDRVIAINKALGADTYINAIGGQGLYEREVFAAQGIGLHFLRSKPIDYPQLSDPFVPWLSIIDVMMFNDKAIISDFLERYDLL